ncbi:MAG: hypothetical protein N2Z20_05330 [Elusimicrobiales bacterium]|nr:hypothetical protein [Elusimicrobiales bacterium]
MDYYSVWKDISFYIYVLLAISSAVVIVSSIRRLMDEKVGNNEDNKDEVSMSVYDNLSNFQNEDIKLKSNDTEDVINQNLNKEPEDIVFVGNEGKEETIFDNTSENLEREDLKDGKEEEKTNLGIMFLKNINENLSIIKDISLKIENIEEKINEVESKIISFENEIKEIIKNEISERISKIDNENVKIEYAQNKTTPKYVSKYLSDIIEDFDLLEKDVIKKRISSIVEDLKKISGE